jgi:hypothetical protein
MTRDFSKKSQDDLLFPGRSRKIFDVQYLTFKKGLTYCKKNGRKNALRRSVPGRMLKVSSKDRGRGRIARFLIERNNRNRNEKLKKT